MIKNMKKITAVIKYLVSVHLLGILFFLIFRIILYSVNSGQADVENKGSYFLRSMLIALQFDNYIASFFTCLPMLLLSVFALFNQIHKTAVVISNILFIVLYTCTFVVSVSDIPYFSYFLTHIGASALGWFEFGSVTAGLFLQEKAYYPYIALFFVSIILFSVIVVYFGKKLLKVKAVNLKSHDYKIYIPLTVLIWLICFIGMRGSFQRYPLRTGYAYFSNNSFFNQLGINPSFFLLKSYSDHKKYLNNKIGDLMDISKAISLVCKNLNISFPDENNPLNRTVTPEKTSQKANVVVIFLESMSQNYLDEAYKDLTPYLHELISKSYSFENYYSAGIHTNIGVGATLYGFPALFNRPIMGVPSMHYTGLPYSLHKEGYQNLFFVTSNPNYDHMNSFLSDNHFDRIYSLYDYPKEKVVNNFGVQDDFLFEYALETLNKAVQDDKPFLACLLTVTNHPPFIIPEQFKNKGDTDTKRALAFMDHSLKIFMENAAKQDWYKNTIFVIQGDHGSTVGQSKYDMPLSLNHIPLILHSPLFEDSPKRFSQFCGQIDVFPTILGLLNIPYFNNSLGQDIFKENRPCMFFVNDNQLGCIDNDYFYVYNLITDSDILYDLRNENADNNMQTNLEAGKHLKEYAMSMITTANYLITNEKTGVITEKSGKKTEY